VWVKQPRREAYRAPGRWFAINTSRRIEMSKLAYAAAILAVVSVPAIADTNVQMLRQVPAESLTVTDWYKKDVYDSNNNKIGEVMDVLLDKSGKVTSLIIGVGGFLGAGEKDVAVPFEAVRVTNKNNKNFTLVMNTNKDDLKSAPGFKYDRDTTSWVPDTK
jgi:sporulation protein YlmC with PRC-barrel domain